MGSRGIVCIGAKIAGMRRLRTRQYRTAPAWEPPRCHALRKSREGRRRVGPHPAEAVPIVTIDVVVGIVVEQPAGRIVPGGVAAAEAVSESGRVLQKRARHLLPFGTRIFSEIEGWGTTARRLAGLVARLPEAVSRWASHGAAMRQQSREFRDEYERLDQALAAGQGVAKQP